MATKISTGTLVSPSASGLGQQGRMKDVGSDLMVLFDAQSVSEYSPIFEVRPGEVMLISAFGLTAGQKVIVEKMRMAVSSMPSGSACGGGSFTEGGLIQAEDVTQCGLWALSPCSNLAALGVPGTYRLRLNTEAVAGLGTLYVDGLRLQRADAHGIPEDLHFGKMSACGCE